MIRALRMDVVTLRDILATHGVHEGLPAPVPAPRPDVRFRWKGPNVPIVGGGDSEHAALVRHVRQLRLLLESHGIADPTAVPFEDKNGGM
jgi:hypothetical protein